jgi:C1A family cysteine protease
LIAIILGGGSIVLAIFLALTDGPKRKGGGSSPLDAQVNDGSFIRSVNSEAGGNFTAAASPFFNKWSYGDFKWGMDGQVLRSSGFVGMPGALQHCEKNDDVEAGALPYLYDARESWSACNFDIYDSTNCSASYAIAAAQSLSNRFCIADSEKYGGLKLSPQQVLSCDKKSDGCKGGGIDSVFAYMQRRGLYPESCVPYAGAKGAACKTDCKENDKLKVLSHCVMSGEKAMKREIMSNGPIVAPVFVKDDYLVYSGGVYTPTESSKQQYGADGNPILHAVSVIGWGKSQNTGYWITQSSYGTGWGEQGYGYIAFGSVLREDFALVSAAATDEAIAADEKKKELEAVRKEELKKERAERDARIAERQAVRDAERRAAQEAADDAEFEDDIDLDLDEFEDDAPKEDEIEEM